jgi:alcohol dehydrogenase class IV
MTSSTCIDKLTSYCSALEALFSTQHGELTHLLAERAAIVISEHLDDRIAAYLGVREGYKLRSAYTHGSTYREKDVELTIKMSTKLDSIVRQCLANYFANNALATAMQSDKELDQWFLTKLFS